MGSEDFTAPDQLLVGLEATRMDVDVVFLRSLVCVLESAVVCDMLFVSGVVLLFDDASLKALCVRGCVMVDVCSLLVMGACTSELVDVDTFEALEDSLGVSDDGETVELPVAVSTGFADSTAIDLSASFED